MLPRSSELHFKCAPSDGQHGMGLVSPELPTRPIQCVVAREIISITHTTGSESMGDRPLGTPSWSLCIPVNICAIRVESVDEYAHWLVVNENELNAGQNATTRSHPLWGPYRGTPRCVTAAMHQVMQYALLAGIGDSKARVPTDCRAGQKMCIRLYYARVHVWTGPDIWATPHICGRPALAEFGEVHNLKYLLYV